jgi:hypothetical protein
MKEVLNSRMRRIDLFCKLIGPLVISLIDGFSTTLAVAITGGMTILSVVFEYWSIARVYNRVPALQAPKSAITETPPDLEHTLRRSIRRSLKGILLYVNHPAFLPSLSLALLYMTVLSFSGQMITYLLTLGLSSGVIGALRGISAAVEMSATWLAPKVTHHIGSERAGIWFLNWQILCVAVAGLFFWIDVPSNVAAVGAVTAVIASRVGLWGFDLSAQTIVQEVSCANPRRRSAFKKLINWRRKWKLIEEGCFRRKNSPCKTHSKCWHSRAQSYSPSRSNSSIPLQPVSQQLHWRAYYMPCFYVDGEDISCICRIASIRKDNVRITITGICWPHGGGAENDDGISVIV